MIKLDINSQKAHEAFLALDCPHILMITNHGIHQWRIIPGLPDTGGQNVFVNQFSNALTAEGFKITIANRGGYSHLNTGEWREGLHYKDERQRILYLEDSSNQFIHKENMAGQIPKLVDFLEKYLDGEDIRLDLIISHFWDAAKLGVDYNRRLVKRRQHIWVPHELGVIKKRNLPPEQWAGYHLDERIENERSVVSELDGLAATSATIRQSLQDDYDCPDEKLLFLPPSIDTDRYHPRDVDEDDHIWHFLAERSSLSVAELRRAKIVTEISRTDPTKRKDVLIKAFAKTLHAVPDGLLVMSIDDNEETLARELKALIDKLQIQERVIVVGYIHNILPRLYAVTDVYCTPSVVEGFGMSVQEAAASKTAIVTSHLVPFAREYLLGDEVTEIPFTAFKSREAHQPLQRGQGAIIVHADEEAGFAHALELLLTTPALGKELAANAYEITIPYFTWDKVTRNFLEAIGVSSPCGPSLDA